MSTAKQNFTRARGFTFVELMLGIIVTTIVCGALSVFTLGVSTNWQDSDSTQSAFLASTMGIDRLNRIARSAQMIDQAPTQGSLDNSTAPAACMLWTDENLDGKIQYSEMTLLQFDTANQRLSKYEIPGSASNAATSVASLMSASSFKALPNLVSTPVVHSVSACEIFCLNASATTPHPSIEFVLKMKSSRGNSQTLVYSTAALRGPYSPN